ncbi:MULTISPECIES: amino acid ABC transporter substrate-binding protein [Psychrobacter]|jgi:cystine transport system substrate-binding protein|uniref:amino acid ABC transporter substrate-binding protein n=1 Tax=Psychrobacter TaxID=497 RepID=UPI000C33E9F9|nr:MULTISPECIES: amino acid ABC transporter substrate-binding protein [Psychrobacter]MBA6245635.1 transporter substrate-binding domain-containing protein [Psychrobacter sp. Urea-trap-18]MBA6286375.1 transporter substrate-binding domain-containing protein [Psychrobacter sp. Urea-trap-16]MBA6317206.1 transporter substrate-binding domain-containing protein [Psychrobacter sp. Urea-trap-20]MBA6333465.1 transporter substrate-binding domain-containing protein [Psychrobacter sp. Urea-trap-19]PKG60719.|tara:strand:+ start:28311 stop:29147 length:837 start_codon:yes stop_codon:yes gene_type:complete
MKRRTLLALAASTMFLAACGQSATNEADTSATDSAATGGSDLLQRINNGGTINVGTEGTYPPFTYHDESGKLTGYDVEVTRAVADKLGVDVEFKETQWDAMLAGLDSKRFDMVANQVSLTTPERKAKYDKSMAYSWSGAVVLAPTDDNRYSSWEGLKGLRTAQSLSSNYGELAERYGAEIVPVDGMAQAIQLVKQDRADFTMNDNLAVLDYLKKFPDSDLEIKLTAPASELRGSGLVLIKGDDEVVAKLDEAMAELAAEGTLTKLSEQFFGADISQQK